VPEAIVERPMSPAVLARDAVYRRLLVVSDMVAAGAATCLAVLLGGGSIRLSLLVALPLVVLLAKVLRLYERDEFVLRKTTLDEASALFHAATVYTLGTWIAQDALSATGFRTLQAAILWPGLFLLLAGGRSASRRIAKQLTAPERCIVVGSSIAAEALDRCFRRSVSVSAEVVGRVPLQYGNRRGEDQWGAARQGKVPVVGVPQVLDEILTLHAVDRVLIVPSVGADDELLDVIRAVKAFGVKVSVVPRLYEVIGSSAAIDDVDGTTLLGIRRYGLARSSRWLKRAMDVAGAAAALWLTSPLLIAIAIAIRLDSPGPALFRQRRIGQGEKEFEMVKFRTMSEDADHQKAELAALNEADGLFKIADDPRITRVGRFLRRTSLDELPQLINVLRGEMSLVGPRPLVADDDERVQGWERRRLYVPPGMTGHWQILGSSRVPLGEMVKIDYLYGANWSLWNDVKILLRTVPYVLARRGQ
jgi:exopolysaccharide biosynthesis polyprenyl glycosylphosphotransferase